MTDKKRLEKLKALEDINSRIGGCFGDADKIFAGHAFDEERAKEIRKHAFKNDISLEEIQNIVSGYLFRTGFYAEHCKNQTEKATKFFKTKLK
jgi:hypothetical protein